MQKNTFEEDDAVFPNRYIVDSGFVKQLNHNSRVGMDILEVVPISKYVFHAVPRIAIT